MVFSSLIFLFYFLPITFVVYYITPMRWKNTVLLIASFVFYAWGEARYFPLIFTLTLINYMLGLVIQRYRGHKLGGKLALAGSVLTNIGTLAFFKYSNFIIDNINALFGSQISSLDVTLPLGISFFTFQIMAYCIDVYRGVNDADRNFVDYATALVMFPQLVAGPIVRYSDIQSEIKERSVTLDGAQRGAFTLIMGLGSKVLIANNLGLLWDDLVLRGFANISTPAAWIGLISYALQIYFDFSGYSLMALGMGEMLGFHFPANFNYPYVSKSFTEFWRRWHMTLGSWFRDYVYFPMGGSRVRPARHYFNLLVVWALTGLWHGASWNFVLWGLFFFVFLVIEKAFLLKRLEKSKVAGHLYLAFFVLLSWALFAIDDFSQLKIFFQTLFVWRSGTDWMYFLRNYIITIAIGFVFAMPVLPALKKKLSKKPKLVLGTVFGGLVLFASIAYLVDSTYNPFLYFRF